MVESIFPLGIFSSVSLIIFSSPLFNPLSYLKSIPRERIFILDPNKRDNMYLSFISSKLKMSLLVLRLYLNEGPPNMLRGPRIL